MSNPVPNFPPPEEQDLISASASFEPGPDAISLCGFAFPPKFNFSFGFNLPAIPIPFKLPTFDFSLGLNCSLDNPFSFSGNIAYGGGRVAQFDTNDDDEDYKTAMAIQLPNPGLVRGIMPVQIVINQFGKPAGVAAQAREDLDLGVPVDLQAIGGPFLQVQWSITDKPMDWSIPAQSSAGLTAPTNPVTQVTPIDYKGTYLIKVEVDSGSGLGANPDDIATLTFYAGPALNPIFNQFPRRIPAFSETTQHNAPIAPFAQNPRGWDETVTKMLAAIEAVTSGIFAWARWEQGTGTIIASKNIAAIANPGIGLYKVFFTNPAPSGNYLVLPVTRNVLGGLTINSVNEITTEFDLVIVDNALALDNNDFNFVVIL